MVLLLLPRLKSSIVLSSGSAIEQLLVLVSVSCLLLAAAIVTSTSSKGSSGAGETCVVAPPPPAPPAWSSDDEAAAVERSSARRREHTRKLDTAIAKEMMNEDMGCNWFSMEDARQFCGEAAAEADSRTPSKVLADLQRGNARFWTGNSSKEVSNTFQRRALIMRQFPKVAVLGCSASRVPIEMVFDQDLGGIFAIRVAGGLFDMTTKASLEYAVHHLKVKVVVVMGHDFCGAVKAALSPAEQLRKDTPSLSQLLIAIKSGLDDDCLNMVYDRRARDRESVVANVRCQVGKLRNDEAIMASVEAGELIVLGGFYEISSGIVDFFNEVVPPSSASKIPPANTERSQVTTVEQQKAETF